MENNEVEKERVRRQYYEEYGNDDGEGFFLSLIMVGGFTLVFILIKVFGG